MLARLGSFTWFNREPFRELRELRIFVSTRFIQLLLRHALSTPEVGPLEVGAGEVGLPEVGEEEFGPLEVGAGEVDPL